MIEIKVPKFALSKSRSMFLTTSAWLALSVVGCGDINDVVDKVPVHPVKGSVVLADGKPLEGGSIEFIPTTENGRPAVGVIAEDGTFTLKTGGVGDGAAEGSYKVKVDPDAAYLKAAGKKKKIAYPFAQKYLDEETSGLTATVKPGENSLEPFTLKAK